MSLCPTCGTPREATLVSHARIPVPGFHMEYRPLAEAVVEAAELAEGELAAWIAADSERTGNPVDDEDVAALRALRAALTAYRAAQNSQHAHEHEGVEK